MKKYLLLMLFAVVLFSSISEAKQGCCSWHKGVAYCGSNGYYICNDGTRSPTCTCGTTTYYNNFSNTRVTNSYSYLNSYNYQPTDKNTECKNLYGNQAYYSYYDSKCACGYGYVLNTLNGVTKCLTYDENCQAMHGEQSYHKGNSSCGCNPGYEMINWKCVSQTDNCKALYGENSFYDVLLKSCSCRGNYKFRNGACVSADDSCQITYGTNAKAGEPGYCICKDGYVWNDDGSKCISKDEAYCGIYGSNSYVTYDYKCGCKSGFVWNQDMTQCVSNGSSGECSRFGNAYMDSKGQCKCSNGYVFDYILDKCIEK